MSLIRDGTNPSLIRDGIGPWESETDNNLSLFRDKKSVSNYFNLIYMSKLTFTLNCSISFFPDYCLIQKLSTKGIIGRGHESRGLYILELEVTKFVVCS